MAGLFGFLGGQQRKGNPTLDGRGYIDPAIDGLYSRSLGGQGGYGTPPTAPDQRPQSPPPDPSRRLFGDGHLGGIIGGLGKILTYGPFVGMAQEGINRRRDQDAINTDYKRATIQHMGQTEEPSVIRTAKAIGLQPGTPEFTKFVTDATMAPRYMMMGSPETGQTIVNPNAVDSGRPGPPQAAIDRLRANPAEAAQFDEIFGPGASARAMGASR